MIVGLIIGFIIAWICNCIALYFYDKEQYTIAIIFFGPVAWFIYGIYLLKTYIKKQKKEQFRSIIVDTDNTVYWAYPDEVDYLKDLYSLRWPNKYIIDREGFDFDRWLKEYKKVGKETNKINWKYAPRCIWQFYLPFTEEDYKE